MKLNLVGPFVVNAPFGTEIAFAKGLRRLGHEVIEIDPNVTTYIDPSADATVVFKSCVGNENAMLGGLRHPIVTYQPDDARFPHIRQMMLMMRQYSDLFLSFDGYGAELARTIGYRASETLLLTADDELYCPSEGYPERDIDVSFIGSLGDPVAHASRREMIGWVQNHASDRGWKTVFASTQDVPAILDIYRRSKVVLNHATDVGQPFGYGFGYQCRHFEVGMTRTCLLSNALLGTPPAQLPFQTFDGKLSLIEKLEDLIGSRVVAYDGDVEHYIPSYEWAGEELYADIVRDHRPQHRAAQLVDFIERNA